MRHPEYIAHGIQCIWRRAGDGRTIPYIYIDCEHSTRLCGARSEEVDYVYSCGNSNFKNRLLRRQKKLVQYQSKIEVFVPCRAVPTKRKRRRNDTKTKRNDMRKRFLLNARLARINILTRLIANQIPNSIGFVVLGVCARAQHADR